MITAIKQSARHLAEAVARAMLSSGLTPNQLTVLGFVLNLGVAVILGSGALVLGGILSIVVGAFDMLDGAMARVSGRKTTFGAFLDSTLDRYSEAAMLLALLYEAGRRADSSVELLAFLVVVGSLLVSYTRARAEGLGLDCEVGIAPRPERVLILGIGLIVGLEAPALALLALLTHVTAVQRILYVRRLTAG